MNALIVVLLSAAALISAETTLLSKVKDLTSSCGDQDQPIGACNVHLHICGDIYSWEWKYTGTATEPVSGKSASTDNHYSSETGAGADAAFNLVNNELGVTDENTYDCNCQAQDVNGGKTCQLRAIVCFSFDSTSALQNADPTYRGVAYDMLNTAQGTGTATGYKNATDAGTDAVMNLFSLFPDTAAGCGQTLKSTPVSFEDVKM